MKKNSSLFDGTVNLLEAGRTGKNYYVLASYVAAFILAGSGNPPAAYALLAVSSTPKLAAYKWPAASLREVVGDAMFALIPHAFLAFTATLAPAPQPVPYIAAIAAALVEESFFRFVMDEYGEPVTALLFSLFHISFRSPVYLVSSMLFVPAYFMLGCFFYEVYKRRGLLQAYIVHSVFNVVALLYVADFSSVQAFIFASAASLAYLLYKCGCSGR